MSAIDDLGSDLGTRDDGLAGLIADAARVRLPLPRSPQSAIDLTTAAPRRSITIPDTAAGLVEGYADYGA
jgi:hypothetical protein